jgi:hypothetical protein
VHLQTSKTDIYRQGVNVAVASFPPQHPLSAAMAFRTVVAWRQHERMSAQTPLMTYQLGRVLTKSDVVGWLNSAVASVDQLHGIPSQGRVFGHSLRRGGATSLAHARVLETLIQVLGRWKSSSFRLYISLDPRLRNQAFSALAESTSRPAPLLAVAWSADVSERSSTPARGPGGDTMTRGRALGTARRLAVQTFSRSQQPANIVSPSPRAAAGPASAPRRVAGGRPAQPPRRRRFHLGWRRPRVASVAAQSRVAGRLPVAAGPGRGQPVRRAHLVRTGHCRLGSPDGVRGGLRRTLLGGLLTPPGAATAAGPDGGQGGRLTASVSPTGGP